MNKWYFVYHQHNGELSIFETSEYDGRSGYDSKDAAIYGARSMLVNIQKQTTLKLIEQVETVSNTSSELYRINKALSELENK